MRGGHDIILSAFDNFKEVPTHFDGSPVRPRDGAASCTYTKLFKLNMKAVSSPKLPGAMTTEKALKMAHIYIIRTVRVVSWCCQRSNNISERNKNDMQCCLRMRRPAEQVKELQNRTMKVKTCTETGTTDRKTRQMTIAVKHVYINSGRRWERGGGGGEY